MYIVTDPLLPPVASGPYTLHSKHYTWVHKEHTLERVGIIQRSLSHYAFPVGVVPRKAPS